MSERECEREGLHFVCVWLCLCVCQGTDLHVNSLTGAAIVESLWYTSMPDPIHGHIHSSNSNLDSDSDKNDGPLTPELNTSTVSG